MKVSSNWKRNAVMAGGVSLFKFYSGSSADICISIIVLIKQEV
jgi:hypothetical protein